LYAAVLFHSRNSCYGIQPWAWKLQLITTASLPLGWAALLIFFFGRDLFDGVRRRGELLA
jgi:hypothetical protein